MTLKTAVIGAVAATAGFALVMFFLLAGPKNPHVGRWAGGVKISEAGMNVPVWVELNVLANGTFDAKASNFINKETIHTTAGTYTHTKTQVNVSFNDPWLEDAVFTIDYKIKRGKLTLTYAEDTVTLTKQKKEK